MLARHARSRSFVTSAAPMEPKSVKPTLDAVAQCAGVSPMTVSRVLRIPEKVRPATRTRVEAAMEAVGYVPNLVAGSLASARTRTIAVLVPTIANAIFADTVQGLSDEVEPRGYTVILAQSRYDDAQEGRMLTALLSRRPEALVMVGSPATRASADLLRRAGIPVVETWDLPTRPIDAVAGFDNRAAGVTVARHFAAAGRRRLAFVGGDDPRAIRRWKGFRAASVETGLPAPRRFIVGRNAGAGALAALTLPGDVDAVFAANDSHAIGLLAGLRDAGRRVPDEVAVVGLGDLELGRLMQPALSTIRIDGMAIGRAAAALTLSTTSKRRLDLGFELLVRGSG
jgi:LacI family transcriptional regulator, gluconate utilization system Gnt-I transcriptional repressor